MKNHADNKVSLCAPVTFNRIKSAVAVVPFYCWARVLTECGNKLVWFERGYQWMGHSPEFAWICQRLSVGGMNPLRSDCFLSEPMCTREQPKQWNSVHQSSRTTTATYGSALIGFWSNQQTVPINCSVTATSSQRQQPKLREQSNNGQGNNKRQGRQTKKRKQSSGSVNSATA